MSTDSELSNRCSVWSTQSYIRFNRHSVSHHIDSQ